MKWSVIPSPVLRSAFSLRPLGGGDSNRRSSLALFALEGAEVRAVCVGQNLPTDQQQHRLEDLPEEALIVLLGSRYCDTEKLSEVARKLFGQTLLGWGRIQAICDFVHNHITKITFGYEHAHATRTAWEGLRREERRLPRFRPPCCGLLPVHEHSGALLHRLSRRRRIPPPSGPMDFAAWFDAYLEGRWYTFDPRNNTPRIGRVVRAKGSRRNRCSHRYDVRIQYPRQLQGLNR